MKDLTTVEGTYVNCLAANMDTVNAAISDSAYDAVLLKQLILKIIEPANDTPAKRNFIWNLNGKRSKTEIAIYVTDAYFCGSGLGMNVKPGRYQ